MLDREFLCIKCSLLFCDEQSSDCLYQIEGKLISKRAKLARTRVAIKQTKLQLVRLEQIAATLKTDRTLYFKQRYLLKKAA